MKYTCLLIGLLAVFHPSRAQIKIVENHTPAGRIILTEENEVNRTAALLLQDFVFRISKATLPIVSQTKDQPGDILFSNRYITDLTEDGFRLQTENGRLYISSGGDKGSIYGVVTLLEDYLNVHYYTAHTFDLEERPTLILPEINRAENPAFRYRQTQSYAIRPDSIYKMWFRLEQPSEVFAGNLWVHTFDRILPSDVYGETHPEYYSFIRGERRPGKASQWCLTNPEVFEVVSQNIDSIFRAHPDKKLISVSQNDGNYTNCTCPSCKEMDDREGGPSGSLIYFMNKLAERFPDKEFSTLAYLYTMHPPKTIKPLPNVNIMLCSIDCDREVALTDNASGQDFMKAMKGWSDISNNIFVWDYGINFDNYFSPFPNFPILQKNIQLFKEHNTTMHFSQIGGSKGGDFSEMRAYMVSKLMWNPYLDTDSLMRSFMDGYYGAASPYIYQYVKLLEGALLASGERLWIYDSPVTHKNGMLNANCRQRYKELFDLAEEAVSGQEKFLKRVQMTRLPLQYSELEIDRAEGNQDIEGIKARLTLFEERTAEFEVPTLNERSNSPADYCRLYRERFLPGRRSNLAKGAKVTWIIEPGARYKELGETALTDELFGGTTFVESWIGWEGSDGAFILDMGEEKEIRSIETDFLLQTGAWILLPKGVTYMTSVNNRDYQLFGKEEIEEDRALTIKFVGAKSIREVPVRARYIKVEIEGGKICPSWHYGVGHPSWFFVDEVTVL